jgi:membrane-associated phospholipid phosphatase
VSAKRGSAGALILAAVWCAACGDVPSGPGAAEADAGSWSTWVITDGASLRPPAPPAATSAQTASEIEEILRLQANRTPALDSAIRRWDALPTTPWHDLALDRYASYWALLPDVRVATPARTARGFALLHVAIYDALVATWDAKYTYGRLAPARADSRVSALVSMGDVPSYPSEHAAAAAAAATILAYLLPHEDSAGFQALAREAGEARIAAGGAYRSDVESGLAIGRAVAAQVLERARADGADTAWTGTVPDGPSMWRPTPPRYVEIPFDGAAGQWRTWVIPAGDAYRPAPPPAMGSAAFSVDLDELRTLTTSRTAQADSARYWA